MAAAVMAELNNIANVTSQMKSSPVVRTVLTIALTYMAFVSAVIYSMSVRV